MAVYTTRENQSLLDVAVQLTGSTDYLIALAALNNRNPTDILPTGTTLTYDETLLLANPTARLFDLNDLKVATATTSLLPTESLPTRLFTRIPFPAYVPTPTDYLPRANQSMLDVATQLYGSLDNLVALCAANGKTVAQVAPVNVALVFDLETQQESTTASKWALNDQRVVTWSPLIGTVAPAEHEYEPSEYSGDEYA